jgi:hypothetical protein
MSTNVSICSAALMMLGDQPITSMTEDSDRAILARGLYDSARDQVLR